MSSFNRVILMGNLTREPELRYTPKGMAVCQITLAVNRSWTDEAGIKKEEVSFLDCDAFGKTAETIGQHIGKGGCILVDGRLKQDTWDDKATGQKRSKLKVVVESFRFTGRNGKEADGPAENEPAPRRSTAAPTNAPVPAVEDDDPIPF